MKEKNNTEISALISLLDEPDMFVFERIREKILHHGPDAVPLLEEAWDNSFNRLIQNRIEEIVHMIQFRSMFSGLNEWKESGGRDIMEGMIMITKYQYPDLNTDEILKKVDIIGKDIWLEINENLTALEKIKVINHIVFEVHRFRGNKTNFDNPGNYFINDLLSTRKGSPVSLGILYMYLAQKAGIPVYGVDLPQHFILAYTDLITDEVISLPNEEEVLFYINPFNRGAVFTRREIDLFLKQLNLKSKSSYYLPCSNLVIIKRMIQNLRFAFKKSGNNEKAAELMELEKIF
ncbi:MAG: transglutaminase family protein [Bacteroidales bacterium]|nr:transglutaminase family protein [Bacteroidales bacterium]